MAILTRRGSVWAASAAAVLAITFCIVALIAGVPLSRHMLDLDKRLPPGYTQTHESVTYFPFSGETTINSITVFNRGIGVASAGSVTIEGFRQDKDGTSHFKLLDLHAVGTWDTAGNQINVAKLRVANLQIAPLPSTLPVGLAAWSALIATGSVHAERLAASGLPGTITAASLDATGMNGNAIRQMSIENVNARMAAQDTTITIASVQLHNRLWRVDRFWRPADGRLEGIDTSKPSITIFDDVTANFGSWWFHADALRSTGQIAATGNEHDNAEIAGGIVHVSRKLRRPALALIDALALDGAPISAGADGDYEAAKGRATLNRTFITLPKLGSLSITGSMRIERPALSQGNAADLTARLRAEVFERASIRWDDAGLTNRLVEFRAAQANISADQMREIIEARVERFGGSLSGQPNLAAQLVAFIDRPQSIVIDFNPATPLALSSLIGIPPSQIPTLLGMQVTAQ